MVARNRKYDWDSWFDCEMKVVLHGHDFDTDPRTFAHQVRNVAKMRNLDVWVKVRGRSVYFFTFEPDGEKRVGGHLVPV